MLNRLDRILDDQRLRFTSADGARDLPVIIDDHFGSHLTGSSAFSMDQGRQGDALALLNRVCEGEAKMADLKKIRELSQVVCDASLCGLGKSAPNPILSTLRYFEHEYIAHIKDKKCPAGVCRALTEYRIDEELCNGCRACVKVCAVEAITGEKKKPHVIEPEICTVCGACRSTCRFDAIATV